MDMFHRHSRNGKRLLKKSKRAHPSGTRFAALLLCLSMLTGMLSTLAAAEGETKFAEIARFQKIELYRADENGNPKGDALQDHVLIGADDRLALRYEFHIPEEQSGGITADAPYYLEISPHLLLSLGGSWPLMVEDEEGNQEQFGTLHAGGGKAWVTFSAKTDGSGNTKLVLSDWMDPDGFAGEFHLGCGRAAKAPDGEKPVEEGRNLYAMKFESGGELLFGYAENEPATARAKIEKGGSRQDKTITWTIHYTPWQNPGPDDGVALNTPFELRDTIESALHHYEPGSAIIGGRAVQEYASRTDIPENAEAYVLAEASEDGKRTLLTFGGTKFNAGTATMGDKVEPVPISYRTTIDEELLLPGSGSGTTITNKAGLFAGTDDGFRDLGVSGSHTVTVSRPVWLEKTGKTTRHEGQGSTTEWEVIFHPNGFAFTEGNQLTLHDQLPQSSTPVAGSLKVNGTPVTVQVEDDKSFTVSSIPSDGTNPVRITYQTQVPEDFYNDGTDLGNNTAWFTFDYDGVTYTTSKAVKPVGSGDGSGTSGTATLTKADGKYNPSTRTIKWTVNINPHHAYLTGGTFTDDLGTVIPACGGSGHGHGLELADSTNDITVLVNDSPPTAEEQGKIAFRYDQQVLTVRIGELGAKKVTLAYETRVCDPCVFANNTQAKTYTNSISTKDMIIGQGSTTKREASAVGKVEIGATVLTKQKPVYDYERGVMNWTVVVDTAGLPMSGVVLADTLPDGLTYVDGSFAAHPEIPGASARAEGQELSISLGEVTKETKVTFQTKVNPEALGFQGDQPVRVENTVRMNGRADGAEFLEVSHRVEQSFANHGLVKSSRVDQKQELIRYEVLINPFHLALPEKPVLEDTLDRRLQLDADSLMFYRAEVAGTMGEKGEKPTYTITGEGQKLNITDFDPAENRFSAALPIDKDSLDTYVLTYTADILDLAAPGYTNSVRFDGGSVVLGGGKENTAPGGGGGGGGGSAVASRRASIAVVKTDRELHTTLEGVTFTLYQWDTQNDTRGLPFAQGTTDARGAVEFKVKPGAVYELVETGGAPGYGTALGWETLPEGVTETANGLLIPAGAAKSRLALALTNEAHTTDIVFRLVNESGVPMAGEEVELFASDPTGDPDASPAQTVAVFSDGTVRFQGMRRGSTFYIRRPGGGVMTVEVPAEDSGTPRLMLDGTPVELTADYQVTGVTEPDRQWDLTVRKVISGGTTPLPGAAIGLYADAACRTLIKSDKSAQDGTVTFSGLIRGQTYWVRETAPPDGYQLSSRTYEGAENNSSIVIENMPQAPVTPGKPDEPNKPGGPNIPGEPDVPDKPSTPDAPDSSDEPGVPNMPSFPNIPHIPNEPDASSIPDTSNEPDTLIEPDTPGEPGTPDPPGSGDAVSPVNDRNVPQTGDHTQLWVAVILLSGILLAAATLYRVKETKKRKEK